jgi:hypothetical protein
MDPPASKESGICTSERLKAPEKDDAILYEWNLAYEHIAIP